MRFEGELHYTKVDSICGKLIHLVPMNDTCTEAQLDWASLKISNFALSVLIQDDKDKARNLITSTTDVGVYGSLRGHLFENLAHECIMLGGKFRVRNLNDGSISEVSFPKRQMKRFTKVNEAEVEKYNVPNSKTFQSVDSIVPPYDLFQMTVSRHHGIKEEELKNLEDILDKGHINFYFVTLLEHFEDFKMAKLGDDWNSRIHQKVIGISLSTIPSG